MTTATAKAAQEKADEAKEKAAERQAALAQADTDFREAVAEAAAERQKVYDEYAEDGGNIAERAWNETKLDEDPDYNAVAADHRRKLDVAVDSIRTTGSAGIAGLEDADLFSVRHDYSYLGFGLRRGLSLCNDLARLPRLPPLPRATNILAACSCNSSSLQSGCWRRRLALMLSYCSGNLCGLHLSVVHHDRERQLAASRRITVNRFRLVLIRRITHLPDLLCQQCCILIRRVFRRRRHGELRRRSDRSAQVSACHRHHQWLSAWSHGLL